MAITSNWKTEKFPDDIELVWKSLSVSKREEEYSPSSVIGGDYKKFINEYKEKSNFSRSKLNSKKYHYGKKNSQQVELAIPNKNILADSIPLLVFIHGGYWQELSLEESFFPALECINKGIAFASIEYTLAPNCSLNEIVQECRTALSWLYSNHKILGFDNKKIIVSGSSAGAHLAAMCSLPNLDINYRLYGVVLVSGIFELQPLLGLSINDALNLNKIEAGFNSPIRYDLQGFPNAIIAWGSNETNEFKRQSKLFYNKLVDASVLTRSIEIPNRNHFNVILDITNFDLPLGKEVHKLINL